MCRRIHRRTDHGARGNGIRDQVDEIDEMMSKLLRITDPAGMDRTHGPIKVPGSRL